MNNWTVEQIHHFKNDYNFMYLRLDRKVTLYKTVSVNEKRITEYPRKYPIYVFIVNNSGWKDLHTKVAGGNDER